MKKCVECNHETEDFSTQCPECGAGSFVQGVDSEEVGDVLSGYEKQAKSAEIVDAAVKYFQQGQHDKAIQGLKEAIEINPNNATAHGNFGFILNSLGKFSEAIPYLEKALQLNPHLEGIPEVLLEARKQGKSSVDKVQESSDKEFCPKCEVEMKLWEGKLRCWKCGYQDSDDTVYSDDSKDSQRSKNGGCFIATACYDDFNHPDVVLLRKYRDDYLLPYKIGKIFVSTYYSISPPFANLLKNKTIIKFLVRKLLNILVASRIRPLYK